MKGAPYALALGAGYVLGRRKKLRTAAMLAMAAAGGGVAQKLRSGTPDTPLGKLASAGTAAARAAVKEPLDALGSRLSASAEALQRGPDSGQQQPEGADR